VALIGRANVGKSTFLNTALGEPLAIVSSYPQTTRDALLGVVTREDVEFALLDSPGLHKPHNELGRRMNQSALETMRRADYALVFVDVMLGVKKLGTRTRRRDEPGRPGPKRSAPTPSLTRLPNEAWFNEDARLIDGIAPSTPWAMVLNKVDQLKDKSLLLPLLSALSERYPGRDIIPTSSIDPADVDRVLTTIAPAMPERPARYGSDTLTDRPLRYFAAEYIREQVMRTTHGELPFAVAVTIDEFNELDSTALIQATISVEKDGQRVILIGRQGHQIREIGILARKRIEHLLQKKVHLQLFVRTSKHWKDNQNLLAELGYGNGPGAAPKVSKI
jgi:GTP-binding protein Era